MNPVIFALQFLSVAFWVVIGMIWTVTNCIYAWTPNSKRSEGGIFLNALLGVFYLSIAVLLAALYGWIG